MSAIPCTACGKPATEAAGYVGQGEKRTCWPCARQSWNEALWQLFLERRAQREAEGEDPAAAEKGAFGDTHRWRELGGDAALKAALPPPPPGTGVGLVSGQPARRRR